MERQLLEPFAPEVVLVDPLVLEPLPHRPLPRLFEPLAHLVLQQEVEAIAPPAVRRVLLRRQPHGIHAAGPRPVRVDPAAFVRQERARLGLVVVHAQHDHRRLHVLLDGHERVLLEEIARCHPEPLLHAQHVVRREEDVHVAAALVEARDPGMAGELEAVVRAEPGGVLQYLLFEFPTRIHGGSGPLLVAHSCSPSASSTIISRVADGDQTGSGSEAPVVGFNA